MKDSLLHPDRFFDPDPQVRGCARDVYRHIKDLPIVCPHGHVDPRLLAFNKPFPDPAELFIIPDHYLFRMLYSQGTPLEELGIPTSDGSVVERDHRKIWQRFADNFYLFKGTPTSMWLQYEFTEVFGITEKLTRGNASHLYDILQEKIDSPEFLPRALYERFNIEVLSTTDGPSDTLEFHREIRESGWKGRVLPCFRPDVLFKVASTQWQGTIDSLQQVSGISVIDYKSFIAAIENRREFFKEMGAVSTDHGVEIPWTHEMTATEADSLFRRALSGTATAEDEALFTAHMLMEMARMSIDDGLTMQLHPGSYRNHNSAVFDRFGADKGCDIPVRTEFTRNLHALLNKYGNDSRLTLIVFTLDENTYSGELAPLAGVYPAMKLGPAWWFHDSLEGMIRYRERVTETAGFYNTVGFNDDTRAFASIPARHDLCRRVDANFLARQVCRHTITMDDAMSIARALTYDLVKKAYNV
ncbi:MAG: glucuronate isomerase [Chitinispirillaceae bacterium]|nr:glucuronate isomerase [Chitinispirillaceae bacterium]